SLREWSLGRVLRCCRGLTVRSARHERKFWCPDLCRCLTSAVDPGGSIPTTVAPPGAARHRDGQWTPVSTDPTSPLDPDRGTRAARAPRAGGAPRRRPRGRGARARARADVVLPPITYPEALPVSARREDIARAIAEHQVVIVSGET